MTGNVTGAKSGEVVTVHGVILRADGTTVDLGVLASSDPDHTPVTERREDADGENQG
jgi:hypothetical protein